jgi:hypothetical protein
MDTSAFKDMFTLLLFSLRINSEIVVVIDSRENSLDGGLALRKTAIIFCVLYSCSSEVNTLWTKSLQSPQFPFIKFLNATLFYFVQHVTAEDT